MLCKLFLTDEQEKELFHIISTCTPEEAGVGIFANWTAPLACRLVEERFQVKFSERGMRDLFYRIGLSYTRPTYTLNKADPEKQDALRQQFEGLKKLLSGEVDVMLFEDESMIRDYQAIMKTWFPVGKQRIIPTYGKHEGVKLVGFLDGWLKNSVINNVFFSCRDEIKAAVMKFIDWINTIPQTVIDRLCL